jgi:hypothetical protein
MCLPVKTAITILLLFFGVLGAFAQENIAVHPLSDETGTPMTAIFIEELIKAIPAVPGYTGVYRPYVIDLENNRPADVPPGGFPPYICPSSSVTLGSSYAMTGEVGLSKDNPGEYYLRIYLWQMDNGRLLASDMVNAADRPSSAASFPYVLAYLYSVIDESKQMAKTQSVSQQPEQAQSVYKPTSRPRQMQHWLNLGLHGGVGSSTWVDGLSTYSFMNINAAFQIGANVFSLLTVQLEANFDGHFNTEDFSSSFWNMSIPLLLKLKLQNDPIRAYIYAGPYLFIPLRGFETPFDTADFYNADLLKVLGISCGVTVGWRIGPGFFTIDGRLNNLLFFSNNGVKSPSNKAVFSIGYEIDLIVKRQVKQ